MLVFPVEHGVVVLDLHLEILVVAEGSGGCAVGGAVHGLLHGFHVPPEFGGFCLVADVVVEFRHGDVLLGNGDLDLLFRGGGLPGDVEVPEPCDLVSPVHGVREVGDADTVGDELLVELHEVAGETRPLAHCPGEFLGDHAVVLETLRLFAELGVHGEQRLRGEDDVVEPVAHAVDDLRALQEVRVRTGRLPLCAEGCGVERRVAIDHPLNPDPRGRGSLVVLQHLVVDATDDLGRRGAGLRCLAFLVEKLEVGAELLHFVEWGD